MRTDGSLRPRPWSTLITLPAVLVLIGLGVWQVERHGWKQDLLTRIHDRIAAPVVALPDGKADLDSFEFRRTRAVGTFLHDREMYLAGRTMAGRAGYHLLTPLRLDGGGILMVDRGWIPFERHPLRAGRQIPTVRRAAVQGIIRRPVAPGWAIPDNQPARNDWYSVDIPAMARYARLDPAQVRPFYIEADDTPNPDGLPVGGQTRVNLPNNHLQYAVTWFALALVLLIIFFLYHRGRRPAGETE